MHKIIFWALALFITTGVYGQQNDIKSVLQKVEHNNRELVALRSLLESRRFELKSVNNLPDPQLGGYYLPFGEHSTGDYAEFEISQSFEFPTVYSARKQLAYAEKSQLETEFETSRQEILLHAQQLCIDIIFLNKLLILERQRQEQARQVYDQVQELFDSEEIGILELHKAKIVWLQDQFTVQQLETEKNNVLLSLQNLNGRKDIGFDAKDYSQPLTITSFESLWADKLSADPKLRQLNQEKNIATKQLQLARNKSLPNLTAGFNYQGVSGSNYSGVYAGITIPLWSNHNKVNAAKSKLEYKEVYSEALTSNVESGFRQIFTNYESLYNKYTEYVTSVSDMNSQELLYQTYKSGEISFISYYMELQFFRRAIDKKLEMEKELHVLQTELLKHQL